MAKKSWMVKQKKEPKYSTRKYNRCPVCGRARAYLTKFGLCRICFKKFALEGYIPGVKKASW